MVQASLKTKGELKGPSNALAHLAEARLLLSAARAAEAFQHADRALALGADDAATWDIIAGALEALGEIALAVAARERALSLDPDRSDLHAELGRLYEALDRPFDAAARYQRSRWMRAWLEHMSR
jgi:tetratricopeptide (TPR) repeat protein